jgi:hypothetical protein
MINFKRVGTVVLLYVVLVTFHSSPAAGQQILLDKPVRAGELTLYPDLNNENEYYYLSDKPRLANDDNGAPQFSFLRYVENVRSRADQPEAREGEGGGIVHALVALSVTKDQVQEAQREIRRVKPEARVSGPVVYRSGKFALVSSFVDEEGDFTMKVLGLGNAPILDGQKAAVSMRLTKLGSKVLWESFQTPTPDISFSFEMEVGGFRSPHRAEIVANFDQIYSHQSFGVGLATKYLAAEIKGSFDELRREGAIKVNQVGGDEDMEKLINMAYKKLTEMMFQPIGGTGNPSIESLSKMRKGKSPLDRASEMLKRKETGKPATTLSKNLDEAKKKKGGAAKTKKPGRETEPPTFAITAMFEMKKVRHTGIFRIDLNKYTPDNITLRFDENIGDLRSLMADGNHFRQVNLDDPLFKQREIVAMIDGVNASDFGEFMNFVTVQMRKRHESGKETYDEIRIDRRNFNREGNNFKLLYGWKGDNDRRRWMSYDYRTEWSFFGGHTVADDWQGGTAGAINLAPPYQRRSVELEADPEVIADAGVRTITVKLYYYLGDSEQTEQVTLNAFKGELSKRVDFFLPKNQYEYEYEISWRTRGQGSLTSGRRQSSDAILFVDELPE